MKIFSLFLIQLFIGFSLMAQSLGTGLNFNDEEYAKVPEKAVLTRSLYATIPASYSLKQYAPIPKSQGSYGTCTAWATAYAAMTIVESVKTGRTNPILSTDNTFSPGFVYSNIKDSGDANCKNGSSISEALDLVKTKGVPKYTELSEVNCPTNIPAAVYLNAGNYKIKDYAKLFGTTDSRDFKVTATKKSLSQNNPVIIGMSTPSSFSYPDSVWNPVEKGTNFGGHAMCVIGYDDNKFGGAFEFMNSWGTDWGNGGFIWVKYDDYAKFVKYAYEMIDMKGNFSKEKLFEGSITFKLADGTQASATYKNGIYKMNQAFKSGTLFRLYLLNYEPAYVYAFGTDAKQKVFPVFPHAEGVSAALTYSSNEVALPDEDHYIQVDNTIGTDYLCVVYSKEPLDIAEIHRKIEAGTGSFSQKVSAAFGNTLIQPDKIDFDPRKPAFKASDKYKTALAVIIETEHIK